MFAEDKFRTPVYQKLTEPVRNIADTISESGESGVHDVTVTTQSDRFCMTCNNTFTREFTQCPNDATTLVELTGTSLIGSMVGNYRIISTVDEGGMGIIYKAEHVVMQRTVALKMIRSGTVDQDILLRFQQEARAVSALAHPNIVSIFGCEVSAEGIPFLVMEYIDGKNLGSDEVTSRLTLDLAIEAFVAICDALEHAHQKGVVHRDLKPGNIMFANSGQALSASQIKILDFGIAKLLPTSGKESMDLTQTGQPIGSPMYMSPEQCTASDLDARSDIYSLGCVMFFTLTGRAPFAGRSIFELFNRHLSEQPPSISKASIFKVPLELEAIIYKALEKRPEKRFQTMGELKAALISLKNKKKALVPYLVSSFNHRLKTDKFSRNIFRLLVSALVLATTGVCLYQTAPEPMRRTLSQLLPVPSTKQEYAKLYLTGQREFKSGQIDKALADYKSALLEAQKIGKLSSSVYETLLAVQKCSETANDREEGKKVSARLEELRWQNYRVDADSLRINDSEIELLRNQIAGNPRDLKSVSDLCKLLNYRAHQLAKTGARQQARDLALTAIGLESKLPKSKKTMRARAISLELAGLECNELGEPAKAEKYLLEALSDAREALTETSPLTAAIEADLSYSLCQQNKFGDALNWIALAKRSTESLEGDSSHVFSVCLENEGRILAVSGDYKTGERKLLQSLVLRERLFGVHAPECRAIYALLQWVAEKEQNSRLSSYWHQEAEAATSQPLR